MVDEIGMLVEAEMDRSFDLAKRACNRKRRSTDSEFDNPLRPFVLNDVDD